MIPRASCLLAAVILTWSGGTTVGSTAQTPIAIAPLYADYVGGRYDTLRRVFAHETDFRRARGEIFTTVRDWRGAPKPSQTAFLFELAVVGLERNWPDAVALLGATRDLVITRRTLPGTAPAEDAMEVALHRAAIAILTGRQLADAADAYLSPLATRLSDEAGRPSAPRLFDPRASLWRGMVIELRTAPASQGSPDDSARVPSLRIPLDDRALQRRATEAIALYARAAGQAEAAPEAAVRRGFLLHRLGRHEDALVELARASDASDTTVRYWAWLFTGRALEATNQQAAAAAAYQHANTLVPGAQTPPVALASLWQRHGRPDEALRWATLARSTSAMNFDPWWHYWSGGLRMLPTWVADLRRGQP